MTESRTIVVDPETNEMQSSSEPAVRDLTDDVLAAEVLQAFNTVDKNHSFQSADGDNERFARMFPDSKIAEGYKQGQTKMKYMIQYGIAPHIKNLLMTDMEHEQYCFHFDETTTSQIKKQYDGYITYCSKKSKLVVCEYVGSLFVGHCPAEALVQHFYHFIEDLNLDLENVLNLGMDGPNVNKKFERELMEELEKDQSTSFISTGGCPLHTVHNGFGKGMKSLKEKIDLDQFVIDLHFFFERSAARREDFKAMSEITAVTVHYLLKHCESRWLSIEKVLVRVMEQFPNITAYFLESLLKTNAFKGKNGVGNTKRYKRIVECLKDISLMSLMGFVVFVAQDFKKFLIPLQTNAPMIHVLHSMQIKLVHSLMSKFMKPEFITDTTTKKMLNAAKLLNVQVSDKRKHLAKVQVGAKATSELKKIKDEVEKKKVVAKMVEFLQECSQYLLENLPLDNGVIKSAACLHPENRHHKKSLSNVSTLAQAVNKALGDNAMRKAFNMKSDETKYDLLDKIRTQYQMYQMESIDESFYKQKQENKRTHIQKTSYWKEAYGIAGVTDYKCDDSAYKRIDDYWVRISELLDENGKAKYPDLWQLVKCIMLVSHGNADPERGFSINKHMLKIHGFSLAEDTLVAVRFVKDYVIKCSGSEKVILTKGLMNSCMKARNRYGIYQDEQKELKRKEEEANEAAAEAAVALEAKKSADKKKEEKLQKINQQISILKSGISVAEQSISDANQELSSMITDASKLSKTKLISEVTKSQSKVDMGLKRKQELSQELQEVLSKKKKISDRSAK